jgi:hypothetical protein
MVGEASVWQNDEGLFLAHLGEATSPQLGDQKESY